MKGQKLFVVSDIHGHYSIMVEALKKAGFDRNDPTHILICCGDYFDRGRENAQVLSFFERLERKILLRGNHEDMLLKLLQTGKLLPHHYINGTLNTLENFFGKYCVKPGSDRVDFSGKTRTVDRLCDFINETLDYYETEHYVFVHGWLPKNFRNAAPAEWEKARWGKWNENYVGLPPLEGRTLVCGHVPTFYAKPFDPSRKKGDSHIFRGNGLIVIDAGTFDTHRVNVLVLDVEDEKKEGEV